MFIFVHSLHAYKNYILRKIWSLKTKNWILNTQESAKVKKQNNSKVTCLKCQNGLFSVALVLFVPSCISASSPSCIFFLLHHTYPLFFYGCFLPIILIIFLFHFFLYPSNILLTWTPHSPRFLCLTPSFSVITTLPSKVTILSILGRSSFPTTSSLIKQCCTSLTSCHPVYKEINIIEIGLNTIVFQNNSSLLM